MQAYARNMMAVTAASAVLAAGVVTMTPVTADIAAPRIVTTDVALVANAACIRTGTCDIGKNLSLLIDGLLNLAPGPAYVVTQAAYLASDVVEVAAAGVAYGATFATAQVFAVSAAVAENAGRSGIIIDALRTLVYFPVYFPDSDVASAPTVMQAKARLGEAVVQLKEDWANTVNPAHYQEYVAGLAQGSLGLTPVPEVASVRSRPVASLASRARAASVTPRQSPSAKAAAATVEAAPAAEQSQRRATRGAAHRAERSGTGVESP